MVRCCVLPLGRQLSRGGPRLTSTVEGGSGMRQWTKSPTIEAALVVNPSRVACLTMV
jgi:hypothetical protein